MDLERVRALSWPFGWEGCSLYPGRAIQVETHCLSYLDLGSVGCPVSDDQGIVPPLTLKVRQSQDARGRKENELTE